MISNRRMSGHFLRVVRNWKDQNYPGQWIKRGDPIEWHARSPDLIPIDLYLWGTVKSIPDRALMGRIFTAFDKVNENIVELTRAIRTVQRHSQICLEVNDGHFEQFLKCIYLPGVI